MSVSLPEPNILPESFKKKDVVEILSHKKAYNACEYNWDCFTEELHRFHKKTDIAKYEKQCKILEGVLQLQMLCVRKN